MAYLTSFKSGMPRQHWWPSRRIRRVVVVFTEESQVGIIHSLLAQLSSVWQELCVEKTLTREFFKIFSIWTFVEGRQQCSFYSRRCKRMRELELYFTSSWRTARPIIWFNGRPFWSIDDGLKSFFPGFRRCKCRSATSDKSLSKNPPSTLKIPPKFSSLVGARYTGNPNYYCNLFL